MGEKDYRAEWAKCIRLLRVLHNVGWAYHDSLKSIEQRKRMRRVLAEVEEVI